MPHLFPRRCSKTGDIGYNGLGHVLGDEIRSRFFFAATNLTHHHYDLSLRILLEETQHVYEGSNFIDMLRLFQQDPETEIIVMVGEIGGSEEEAAADFIAEHVTKPVVAYIAGFTAPTGKQMGHAGAIISGSAGTAQAKKEALESKGIRVGVNPTEVADLVEEAMRISS